MEENQQVIVIWTSEAGGGARGVWPGKRDEAHDFCGIMWL